MNIAEIKHANSEWEQFANRLTPDQKEELTKYLDVINYLNLFTYAVDKDYSRFDLIINQLPDEFLYSDNAIQIIYMSYKERNQHKLAHGYLIKCSKYYLGINADPPKILNEVIDASEDDAFLDELRIALISVRSLGHNKIPKIIPEIINNKRNINLFILHEIVLASKVLMDKIQSIKQITIENRYNDLLLAVLRLRLPIWGWSIKDQARAGQSGSGIDAGEVDVLIEAGGQSIALWEALILETNNQPKVQSHILKCNEYVSYLKRYYMIIYFRGPESNFEHVWEGYKDDILLTTYPISFKIDLKEGFIDIAGEFEEERNLRISKTIHSDNIEVFHVMINLGISA